MPKVILVHHSEIALKGMNRSKFESTLARNIKNKLKELNLEEVSKTQTRVVVRLRSDELLPKAVSSIKKVFGVKWFTIAEECEEDINKIRDTIFSLCNNLLSENVSFRVVAKRANKSFPLSSMQLEEEVGAFLVNKFKAKVDLKNPTRKIYIEITKGKSYIYLEKIQGPGGLPVGVAGKLVSLISGGIDSPVASWLAMKRGAQLVYLHFHPYESSEMVKNSKIKELILLLSEWGSSKKLYAAPSSEFLLRSISLSTPKYNLHLFKKLMFRVAEEIAKKENAKGIVTGDSLSQKASQTLEAMQVTDTGMSLPIIRPLLGYDKDEIVSLAEKIGTYEPSIKEYKDCCSIIAKHPSTKPNYSTFVKLEKEINLEEIVQETLKNIEVIEF
ncbi:MAG: tRNA uracil 4-sulfurtransferase ThiI [Thermoproteota archaeon]|nr:tRNA 4-thiouridine(8) synthase ThiI [Candidatus Brockarchaeota archaeon]